MIRVDRSLVPVPAALSGPNSLGGKELTENASCLVRLPAVPMVFQAYKDRSVADALEQLFGKKCAYCETRYAGIHPVDIEHFRPKKKVRHARGADEIAGYWWLAAEWENLLPSCIDCNRMRYHTWRVGASTARAARGKDTFFPLAAPVCAIHAPGCEKTEVPLLVDPCRDDPSLVFEWSNEGAVGPRRDLAGQPHAKGQDSIDAYGLDRPDLFIARAAVAKSVNATIVRLKKAERLVTPDPSDERWDDIRDEMVQLAAYARADAEFAGMARAIIENNYGPIPP